jgi:hypothetical protein
MFHLLELLIAKKKEENIIFLDIKRFCLFNLEKFQEKVENDSKFQYNCDLSNNSEKSPKKHI